MTYTLKTIRIATTGLVLVGILDLASTLILIHTGYIREGNPVTANMLSLGIPAFATIKLASLLGFLLVVEWYAKLHLARAFGFSVTTLLSYSMVYSCCFFWLN